MVKWIFVVSDVEGQIDLDLTLDPLKDMIRDEGAGFEGDIGGIIYTAYNLAEVGFKIEDGFDEEDNYWDIVEKINPSRVIVNHVSNEMMDDDIIQLIEENRVDK